MENKPRPGDANQITRDYLDSLLIEMRHIGATLPDTSFSLYGQTFSTPIATAALSHLNNCHPDGLVEMARGAKRAGALMFAGMGEMSELENITKTGAQTIKIIKPYKDNDEILRRIDHAKACGCLAVGMDIDHSFSGRGEYDIVLGHEMRGKTAEEIRRFVDYAQIPFVIKGVLSVTDAKICLDAGVRGIVVSHHHGILDYAVPPLMALEKIAKTVAGRMAVFVDCGIETGYDAFKALALGATAVSIGRPMMKPLSDSGANGVAQFILDTTAQLKGVMARTCTHTVASVDPQLIIKRAL